MTWEQRFGALIELDGDEWDAAHKRLEQEWLAAYTVAFVGIAVSRGWRREDAETWPVGIGDEAFIERHADSAPMRDCLSFAMVADRRAYSRRIARRPDTAAGS